MTIHVVHYYDEPSCMELVDVEYQCSLSCMDNQLIEDGVRNASIAGEQDTEGGSQSWGACPCGAETDYDVYCSQCGESLWEGLNP